MKHHRHLAAQALLLLSVFSLLLSTVGVSVHAVYCYCSGVRQLYLIAPDTPSGAACPISAGEETGCCSARQASAAKKCCATKADTCRLVPEKGCMKNTTEVVHLQTDLGKEDVPDWSVFGKWNKAAVFALLPEWQPERPAHPASGQSHYSPLWPHPPPLPSGQFKRILHQSFLC